MSKAPLHEEFQVLVPETAAGDTFAATVAEAPFDGEVVSAVYYPDTAITGADTNSRTLNLHNRGADGTGDTLVASIAFESGTDAGQYQATELALSGTVANLAVSAGDVLTFESESIGDGLVDPGGTAVVTIARG